MSHHSKRVLQCQNGNARSKAQVSNTDKYCQELLESSRKGLLFSGPWVPLLLPNGASGLVETQPPEDWRPRDATYWAVPLLPC